MRSTALALCWLIPAAAFAQPKSAGEYVKKGRPIYVEGRLKYGKYTDKDGVEKNTVDIIATEMQLLGGREGMGGPQG